MAGLVAGLGDALRRVNDRRDGDGRAPSAVTSGAVLFRVNVQGGTKLPPLARLADFSDPAVSIERENNDQQFCLLSQVTKELTCTRDR